MEQKNIENEFIQNMMDDYYNGELASYPYFGEYIRWKKGDVPWPIMDKHSAVDIIKKVTDDIDKFGVMRNPTGFVAHVKDNDIIDHYDKYGENRYVVAYLSELLQDYTKLMQDGYFD